MSSSKSRFANLTPSVSTSSFSFMDNDYKKNSYKEILGKPGTRGPQREEAIIARVKATIEETSSDDMITLITGAKKSNFKDIDLISEQNLKAVRDYFAKRANSAAKSVEDLTSTKQIKKLRDAMKRFVAIYEAKGGSRTELNWAVIYKSADIEDIISEYCDKLIKKEEVSSSFIYSKMFHMGLKVEDIRILLWATLSAPIKLFYLGTSRGGKTLNDEKTVVTAAEDLAKQVQGKKTKAYKTIGNVKSFEEFKVYWAKGASSKVPEVLNDEVEQYLAPFILNPLLLKQGQDARGRQGDQKAVEEACLEIARFATCLQKVVMKTENHGIEANKPLDPTNKGIAQMLENLRMVGLFSRVFTKAVLGTTRRGEATNDRFSFSVVPVISLK